MLKPRILHIAPANTSGVPGHFVQAERRLGYDSRLVTLFSDQRNYFSDICLNLPFIDMPLVRRVKQLVSHPDKLMISNQLCRPEQIPVTWTPHSRAEAVFVRWRDRLWKPRIERAVRKYALDHFDVIQLDGGIRAVPQRRFCAAPACKRLHADLLLHRQRSAHARCYSGNRCGK
ncbi:MAG: hypothetical protein U5R06_14700 [candidate division KSB1 bacterium]|nr:hypothetical protein [candidate division KSB1 bacterium]